MGHRSGSAAVRFRSLVVAHLAFFVALLTTFAGAHAQTASAFSLPPEFTAKQLPSDGNICAPIVICDSTYTSTMCRNAGDLRFGSGQYALFHWQRPLQDPIPLMAIGSSAVSQCFVRNDRQKLTEVEQRVVPIAVFSTQFSVFFSDPSDLWRNEQRRNLWLDLFLQSFSKNIPPPTKPSGAGCVAPSPYQNPISREDVNGDGSVSAIDVLTVRSWIPKWGADLRVSSPERPSAGGTTQGAKNYVDVNGDCLVNEDDDAIVLKFLNTPRQVPASATPRVQAPEPPAPPRKEPPSAPAPPPKGNPRSNPLPAPEVPQPNPPKQPAPLPPQSPNAPYPQPPAGPPNPPKAIGVVYVSAQGSGSVRAPASGQICDSGRTCAWSFPLGTSVTLIAQPNGSANFLGWSTALSSTRDGLLRLYVTASSTLVTARFSQAANPPGIPPQGSPPSAPRNPQPPVPDPPERAPRPKQPSAPLPAQGNIEFAGSSGTITSTTPIFPSLQGCEVSSGRCATFAPSGMRLTVSASPIDNRGRQFSHVFCSSWRGTVESRNNTFTVFAPSEGGDRMRCELFYGGAGGHTISIVGRKFFGTPIKSTPVDVISCNRTSDLRCQTTVPLGGRFTLVYPQFITPEGGGRDLFFCNYYCESTDGRQTTQGRKGNRVQDFGVVSTSWNCGAYYYEVPCS